MFPNLALARYRVAVGIILLLVGVAWIIFTQTKPTDLSFAQDDQIKVREKVDEFYRRAKIVFGTAGFMELEYGMLPYPEYVLKEGKLDSAEMNKRDMPMLGDGFAMIQTVFILDKYTTLTISVKHIQSLRFGGAYHQFLSRSRGGTTAGKNSQYHDEYANPFVDPFSESRGLQCIYGRDRLYIIKSVGPDGKDDFDAKDLVTKEDVISHINAYYDPTNGVLSSGDMFYPENMLSRALGKLKPGQAPFTSPR